MLHTRRLTVEDIREFLSLGTENCTLYEGFAYKPSFLAIHENNTHHLCGF